MIFWSARNREVGGAHAYTLIPASSARTFFADGSLLAADLEVIDGVAVLRHPERTDKEMRGLDYVVEFSRDLENWSVDPPAPFPEERNPLF